jgi:Winged helix DNA-binding domain
LVAERFSAQLLSGPPATEPAAVAERLLAIQGQDPRGARLAVRARSRGVSAADIDRALTDEGSLLITWMNRGTLHLVRSEDYPLLQSLTTPPFVTANARRLAQEGVAPADAERGVARIAAALAEEGPLTRSQLAERVASAGVRTEGQAMVHLLILSCLRGITVRGPMCGRQHAYALVRDWLGEVAPPADRDVALAELARRFLRGHAPADDRDLAKWAGLPLRDARAGLTAIASELDQRPGGLVSLARASGERRSRRLPAARLLGSFDPILHGWRSREFIVGEHQAAIMVGGLFKPFVLLDGRAAGLWRIDGGRVTLEPFGELAPSARDALETDGRAVAGFLGLE